MSSESYIVAIFEPSEASKQEFLSAINEMINNVWDKEKDTCSRYEWTQDASDPGKYVMIETYSNEKEAKAHGETSYFKEFAAQIEPKKWLKTAPIIIVCNGIAGFNNRQAGLWKQT